MGVVDGGRLPAHACSLQHAPERRSAAKLWGTTAQRTNTCSSSQAIAPAQMQSWNAAAAPQLVSFPLAQTGEGISECELIQWFVKVSERVANNCCCNRMVVNEH